VGPVAADLAVAFLLIGSLTKQYVAAEIERDLVGTCMSVASLMEERRARLEELAVAVASDYLIRTILNDKGLERLKTYQGTTEFEDDATIAVVKMALIECP
jgi:hypothetical protein